MCAFLAATSQAPLMSVLMVFEMTLAPALLLPGMIGAAAAYYTASRCQTLSLYSVVAEQYASLGCGGPRAGAYAGRAVRAHRHHDRPGRDAGTGQRQVRRDRHALPL
ncbi:chloride channel protein [Cupriavidus basilensis]